jgi:hypothetical protein
MAPDWYCSGLKIWLLPLLYTIGGPEHLQGSRKFV